MVSFDNSFLGALTGNKPMRIFTTEENSLLHPVDDSQWYPVRKAKLRDYLYLFEYSEIDYAGAYKYFKTKGDFAAGACSALRSGNIYGRNFDWYYSNQAEFVVSTPHTSDMNATIGVAGGFRALTEEYVSTAGKSKLYKMVPFQLQDGINEYGLTASYNVVSTDYGKNVAMPSGEQLEEICALMLVRYILDFFSTAAEAVAFVKEHCKVYFPKALHDVDYELQVMVADQSNTFIITFVENHTEVIDVTDAAPYITNFSRYNVILNEDGTVFTPATQTEEGNAHDTNKISLRGAGLERFNIIAEQYSGISDEADMRALLDDLRYTKMYVTAPDTASPAWLTEYTGGNLTVVSDPLDFADIEELAGQAYVDRDRDNPNTWQTMHSVIYDMSSKVLKIRVQETDEEDVLPLKL